MSEIRSLTFIVDLLDKATAPLQKITGIGDLLDRRKVSLEVDTPGADEAEDSFGRLADNLDKLSEVGEKMGEGLSKAGDQLATAGEKIKEVWDPATQSMVKVAEAADQAGKKVEQAAGKMGILEAAAKKVTSAIDDAKMKLAAIQVAATGFMYSAIGAAAETERLENATKATFGDGAEDILKWAEAGGKIVGVTGESRLAMAQLFKTAKMGNEEIMTTTELVEKYWQNKALRAKLQSAGIGSKEDLAKQIKDVEIGGGRAFGLKQVWGKDALDDVIQYGHGANKVLSLMKKDLKNTADTGEDLLSVQSDLAEVTGEFSEEAGKTLLPVFTQVLKLLTNAIVMLTNIPGGPQIAALGAAFTFVAVSLVFFIGALGQAYLGIQGLMKAQLLANALTRLAALSTYAHAAALRISTASMWLSSTATKAWALGQVAAAGAVGLASGAVTALTGALTVLKAAMLSNPITAAFVVLLAVLILLETKFHIFSNLFKSLEKVDWGKKWGETVAWLGGLWDGLVSKVKWVKELISGGAGAISKLGGGNMVLGGLMLTIPGVGLMVGILKLVYGVLKGLFESGGSSLQFLKDIYNEIRKQFERALNFLGGLIPGWMKKLSEAIDSFGSWLRTSWDKLIAGINEFLASLGLGQIEGAKPGSPEGEYGLSPAEKKKILEENAQAYNIDQAAGSQFGTPAVGAGGVPGYQPAFGGEFKGYNFKSTRYPDLQRTGAELTEEQLLTGEWVPANAVDEFGGFAGDLTQAQIDAFNAKIDAAKAKALAAVTPKAEDKTEEKQKEAKKRLASRSEPKAGEDRTEEQYAQDKQDAIDAGIVEEGSPSYKGKDLTASNWQWGSSEEKKKEPAPAASSPIPASASSLPDVTDMLGGKKESSEKSSGSESKPSKEPSSAPKGTPTGEKQGSTNIVSGGSSGSGGMRAPDTFESPATPASFDSGGRVGETGRAIVHKGEEVISEEDKMAYKIGVIPSILEGIGSISAKLRAVVLPDSQAPAEAITTPAASVAMAPAQPQNIVRDVHFHFDGPMLAVGKIDSKFDLEKVQNDLMRLVRIEIKNAWKG